MNNEGGESKFADWKAPDEEAERKPFGEADEAEQIERTKHLRETFSRESSLGEFWGNAYKYSEKLPILGKTPDEARKLIAEAASGVKLIEQALETFKSIKLRETGQENYLILGVNELQETNNWQSFLQAGKLDVPKLKELIRWLLESHRLKGAELGRPSELKPSDIEEIFDDMDYVLKKVNDYLPSKK
ncbi:MAG: hypothetical protein HY567_01945 [Candidatus Kerfeldbacteria bacterium]|nr:hypothetical protein [Candidatus Kerfeldbacteria bacterium]